MADDDAPVLIVNADDFGLTAAISDGILRGHEEGVVTSTSALALGPAFERSARLLARFPDLGVGAHLAVVGEDPPLLGASEIPTLVDRSGALPSSWRQLLPRVAAGRVDLDDLRREFSAQFDALQSAVGRPLTHVDTHQNLHLWPSIARVALDLAADRGIRAVRVTRSSARSPVGFGVRRLSRRLEQLARARGFRYPQASVGLDEAGHFSEAGMVDAIDAWARAGVRSAEVATHPGEEVDPDRERYRWGYEWPVELQALCSTALRRRIDAAGFRLGTFGDLPELRSSAPTP